MKDPISTAAGFVLCVILSACGVYFMLNLVKSEATQNVQRQQESQSFGPFDDANADLVGLPRKPKPKHFHIP